MSWLARRYDGTHKIVNTVKHHMFHTSWITSTSCLHHVFHHATLSTYNNIWAQSSLYFREFVTKLKPLTSQTYAFPLALSISKPQTVWLNASETLRAISFSALLRTTGYRTSLPALFRSTLPSKPCKKHYYIVCINHSKQWMQI